MDTSLVVEAVDPPSADVIYAWGTSENVTDSGWRRRTGRFDENGLTVLLSPGVTLDFRMTPDGTISAEYTNTNRNPRWNSTAVLQKID